jgi:hypothetical protein
MLQENNFAILSPLKICSNPFRHRDDKHSHRSIHICKNKAVQSMHATVTTVIKFKPETDKCWSSDSLLNRL